MMKQFDVIVTIIAALFVGYTAQAANQQFAIEPEDVSVAIGSRVMLPCRVIGKQGVLQWTKDDFGLGTHRNLTAFDRYTMVGNEDDGDHNLQIESVQMEDDAKYQCQVSPGPQGKWELSSRMRLFYLFACMKFRGGNPKVDVFKRGNEMVLWSTSNHVQSNLKTNSEPISPTIPCLTICSSESKSIVARV